MGTHRPVAPGPARAASRPGGFQTCRDFESRSEVPGADAVGPGPNARGYAAARSGHERVKPLGRGQGRPDNALGASVAWFGEAGRWQRRSSAAVAQEGRGTKPVD